MKKIILMALVLSACATQAKKSEKTKDFYNPKTGIYAAKPGASVKNISQQPTGELKASMGKSAVKGQEATENSKPFSRVSDFSNPSRYMEIKAPVAVASDEIDFWVRQMSEHALFLHLGFEDAQFKAEALEIHQLFEDFRTTFNANPNSMEHMNTVLPLLKREREFQIKALTALEEGKWIGWIFPLFINHTTLELDYLTDKLNAIKYSPQDELVFWNRINSEHAAFAAHLLDPAERELFLKADKLSMKFNNIPKSEKEMMVKLSLKASKELDEFNKTARTAGKAVKSIIHPVLLDHVIREGERSIKTLQELNLHKEAGEFASQYQRQVQQYNK
ncbi:MAG TPA: DUF2935 domain-containing protein [Candidatus Babeliales bacterium]|nr:DUF2935 domain-containing protein [Candidatus Babeliales bacterium]